MKINHIINENAAYSPEEEAKARDYYVILKQEDKLRAIAFEKMFRKYGVADMARRATEEEYERMLMSLDEDGDSVNEAEYSVTVNGQTQHYKDIRGADVRIWKHIQGLEQKNNKEILSKSPEGKVDPSKIILKRNGVEVPHKYTGKEKQPITGPLIKEAMSDAYGIVSAEPEVESSVEFKQHKNTDKSSVSIEAAGDTMQDLADVLKLAGLTLPKDMHNDQEASAHDDEPEQEDVLLSPDHKDDEEKSPCDNPDTDPSYETDKEILINYIKDKLKKSIS